MQSLMIKLFFILIAIVPACSYSMNVWYFGLTSLPPMQSIQNKKATICLLDRYKITKEKLSRTIKAQVLNSANSSDLINNDKPEFDLLTYETLCQYEAIKLKVKQLPAIVFNKRYVVYGQRNIAQAINEFKNYQERDHVK